MRTVIVAESKSAAMDLARRLRSLDWTWVADRHHCQKLMGLTPDDVTVYFIWSRPTPLHFTEEMDQVLAFLKARGMRPIVVVDF